MRGAALLLAFALAGCLEVPGPTVPLADRPIAATWAYACPGGPPGQAPCAVRLENATEALTGPFLAVDPGHPTAVALAATAASGSHSLGPAALLPALLAGPLGRPEGHPLQPRLFLSPDAGATWSAAPAPPAALPEGPPGQIHFQVPLGLAHAGARLHAILLEGWANPDGAESAAFLHHATFSGGVWSSPVVLGEAGNHAALLVVGSRVLVATAGRDGAAVHESADDGRTWAVRRAPATEGCRSIAGFLAWAQGPLLACYGQEAPARILVADGDALREVGRLERGFWSLRLADDGERLVLLGDATSQDGDYTLLLSTSTDGAEWSTPRDLLAELPLGPEWSWGRLGPVVGARGHVHLWVQQGPQSDGLVGMRRTEAVGHAVLDASAGVFVAGRELAAHRGESSRSPFPLGADLQAAAAAAATPSGLLYGYGFARGIEVGSVLAG